jgi:hypothetical protein
VTYLQLAHQTGFSRGSATSNSFNCASDRRHLNDTAPFRRQSSLDNVFFPDSAVFFPDSAIISVVAVLAAFRPSASTLSGRDDDLNRRPAILHGPAEAHL